MQKCIFAQPKCILASNAFDAKMHFCNASNAFLHQMHFCTAEHFPLENVRQNAFCRFRGQHQMHFCIKCIFATQNKMYASLFFAKQKTQHFCIKCIFAQLNIFLWKMFSKTKCYKCICNILLVQKYIFAK